MQLASNQKRKIAKCDLVQEETMKSDCSRSTVWGENDHVDLKHKPGESQIIALEQTGEKIWLFKSVDLKVKCEWRYECIK